jgi:hypothetical protein
MSNKYYIWWKQNKLLLSLIPAAVFWAVSMVFFVVGLQFKNPVVMAGKDLSMAIAISLSVSNTIIQIIGNDQEQDEMGFAMWLGWIGSYVLGIGTNTVGLVSILGIENVYIEWSIALGLGTVIEVMPERLLVQFLKGFVGVANGFGHRPHGGMPNKPQNQFQNQGKGGQGRPAPRFRVDEEEREGGEQFTFHGFNNTKKTEKKPDFTFRK